MSKSKLNRESGWYKGLRFEGLDQLRLIKFIESQGVSARDGIERLMCVCSCAYRNVFDSTTYHIDDDCRHSELDRRDVVYTTARLREVTPDICISDIIDDDMIVLTTDVTSNRTLDKMFEQQRRFMNMLCEHRDHPAFPVDMMTKAGQKIVKDTAHECMHELFEAVHLLKNSKKHRKTNVDDFDRDHFLEELADTLHYFIGVCQLAGITVDELYCAYVKKGTVNVSRILEGY